MFYDLESPQKFVSDVYEVLAEDGIWVFEQSYMPAMLELTAYDTICHEHLEYYGMRQIDWLLKRSDMKILDVILSDINGGSFCVTAAKSSSKYRPKPFLVRELISQELCNGLNTLMPYKEFEKRVFMRRQGLLQFVANCKREGKTLLGYGASTKGNVILQIL